MEMEMTYTAQRENGTHPTMNWVQFNNRWVVRDKDGKYVDHDKYRHDLMSKYNNDIEFIGS